MQHGWKVYPTNEEVAWTIQKIDGNFNVSIQNDDVTKICNIKHIMPSNIQNFCELQIQIIGELNWYAQNNNMKPICNKIKSVEPKIHNYTNGGCFAKIINSTLNLFCSEDSTESFHILHPYTNDIYSFVSLNITKGSTILENTEYIRDSETGLVFSLCEAVYILPTSSMVGILNDDVIRHAYTLNIESFCFLQNNMVSNISVKPEGYCSFTDDKYENRFVVSMNWDIDQLFMAVNPLNSEERLQLIRCLHFLPTKMHNLEWLYKHKRKGLWVEYNNKNYEILETNPIKLQGCKSIDENLLKYNSNSFIILQILHIIHFNIFLTSKNSGPNCVFKILGEYIANILVDFNNKHNSPKFVHDFWKILPYYNPKLEFLLNTEIYENIFNDKSSLNMWLVNTQAVLFGCVNVLKHKYTMSLNERGTALIIKNNNDLANTFTIGNFDLIPTHMTEESLNTQIQTVQNFVNSSLINLVIPPISKKKKNQKKKKLHKVKKTEPTNDSTVTQNELDEISSTITEYSESSYCDLDDIQNIVTQTDKQTQTEEQTQPLDDSTLNTIQSMTMTFLKNLILKYKTEYNKIRTERLLTFPHIKEYCQILTTILKCSELDVLHQCLNTETLDEN